MEASHHTDLATWEFLQELDPSPIDSPAPSIQEEDDTQDRLPEIVKDTAGAGTRSPPSHALGLSGLGGSHGAIYYLTRLQKYSTYAFSTFLPLHLASTSLLPLLTRSLPASEKYLLLVRPYYQSPIFEELVIFAPLAIHILSGAILRINRRNSNLKRYGASHLSIPERLRRRLRIWPAFNWAQASGWALVGLLCGHILINRLVPLYHEGSSSGVGLAYVAHGFARHPIFAWAGNVALIGVSAAHIVWGWARWSGYLGPKDKNAAKKRRWLINGIVCALSAAWAAGGLGVVARGGAATGWVGKGFDELYAAIPIIGVYM